MGITYRDGVFRLGTDNSSYIFRIRKQGQLEQLHYGFPVPEEDDCEVLAVKQDIQYGSSVMYDVGDSSYCLDSICCEWSGHGRGDYRQTPIEVRMCDGSLSSDFVYMSHRISEGCMPMEKLPTAYDEDGSCRSLEITMKDRCHEVYLKLYYTVFPRADVISRRAVIINEGEEISLRRFMSMSLDIPDKGFRLHTLDGGWIKETHHHVRPVEYGITVNSSVTGNSSNRHNAGFFLSAHNANEDFGECYGFNLIYSGNHFGLVEKSNHDLVRIQTGINPLSFEWNLKKGECFESPEAVMTYSDKGLNGMSGNFHRFVNHNIVRGEWKLRERPVLINNWESCFFKFDEDKLLSLARNAKNAGAELFVMDDGWFGNRSSDTAGLGDYSVNSKKLPHGLEGLADKIEGMGMRFGLWFEPEGVNPDSELYRAHPDWAVKPPAGEPCLGRNQLLLDLTREEVREYIVRSVGDILDSVSISYVKWDMNRHISDAYSPVLDNQGEFYHRYILGLYEVLGRIFRARPHILLESCSSGGNRFDLGMLCYSPQIWASDNTDPVERLKIQNGLSYLYPQSTMGAHVSAAPHQQTLRDTPLSTRFNVSAFGVLGYELELKYLTREEFREVREQIEFYKKYRKTLQFGTFFRFDERKDNKLHWQVSAPDGSEHVAGHFQTLCCASEGYDELPVKNLERNAKYALKGKKQRILLKRVGGLVKHVLPVELDPNGLIMHTGSKFFSIPDGTESYVNYGATLMAGVKLNNQFMGTGYNERLHMLGDCGSVLYTIERLKEKKSGSRSKK
ncbi:MAG: alpha-galactosidase [Oscillospiraceae bacterium]|nr:alpha-galactosidase [Oscillospiraceae bacterium]